MRGITETARHEALLNPSYLELPAAKAPGWGINGPGVSAEWSQGGESEWNSVAAAADETRARIWQDIEVPRAGEYKVWVRYADWGNRTENFTVRIEQQDREVFRHEFGAQDLIDPHDETSMYWQWVFAWDGAAATLAKGPARISIEPPLEFYQIDNLVEFGSPKKIKIGREPGSRQLRIWGTLPPKDPGLSELLAIHDPALYAALALRDALTRRGVTIRGDAVARFHRGRAGRQPDREQPAHGRAAQARGNGAAGR